ncbi:MAG TPA: DMT family transporter [Mycobacterium sp.]|nr:DMT family transporter [Mycobacterium sp.]
MLEKALVVAAALAGAVFTAIGIVVRQRATMDVPADQGVSTLMVKTLLYRPLWWAGTGAAVVGYAFQALALAYGSLLLVAPLLVSALLFALPLSAWLSHRRVGRTAWGWASVLTLALSVFVALARTKSGDYEGSELSAIVAAAICAALVCACLLAGMRFADWRRAILLAIGVGMLFGVVAVLTKIVMNNLTTEGMIGALASPVTYLLFAVGVAATLLQQAAFHAGSLQASVPAMLVLEPVVAVMLGQVVLGEHLAVDRPSAIALGLAMAAMVAATIALGRDEGAYEEELEAAARRQTA